MIPKGFKLPIFGLLIGFGVGLSVLWFKQYILSEILDEIQTEAQNACNCKVSLDSIYLSFLQQAVIARNVKLTSDNGSSLEFKSIVASFSLQDILSRKIYLDIDLLKGHAEGIGEKSATYRFIDQLATPSTNPKPKKITIKLETLTLLDSTIKENFTHSELSGSGVSMRLVRGPDGDFILTPNIHSLNFTTGLRRPQGKPRTINLGSVSSTLVLRDNFTDFRKLILKRNEAFLSMVGKSLTQEHNALEGRASFAADARSLKLSSIFAFGMEGTGTMAGVLAEPQCSGELKLAEASGASIVVSGRNLIHFSAGTGAFAFELDDDIPILKISKLSAQEDSEFQKATFESVAPFTLHDDILSGKFHLNLSKLIIGGSHVLNDLSLDIGLGGSTGAAEFTVRGVVGSYTSGSVTLSNLALDVGGTEEEKLRFTVTQSQHSESAFEAKGVLSIDTTKPFFLEETLYTLNKAVLLRDEYGEPKLYLNSKGSVSGPLSTKDLISRGSFSLRSAAAPDGTTVKGEFVLKDAVLDATAKNEKETLTAKLGVQYEGTKPSSLSIVMNDFVPAEIGIPPSCTSFAGTADYTFTQTAPLAGNGKISLRKTSLGCNPYQLNLEHAATIGIQAGKLHFDSIRLVRHDAGLAINGSLSLVNGYDLNVSGNLAMNALSSFAPSVDELQGEVSATLQLKGPLSDPIFTGRADLKDATLLVESSDVSAQNINGTLLLTPGGATFKDFKGELNGGSFKITGSIYPFESEKSKLLFKAVNVLVEPQENASLMASAELLLSSVGPLRKDRLKLEGKIDVDTGELQENIDLTNVLKILVRKVFATVAQEREIGTGGELPPIDLDIQVRAPHSLFVTTNWAGAEMKADLHLAGTLNNPTVDGTVESISGQFTIKDRQFSVTSGTIRFRPGSAEPLLYVVSESSVRSHTGETVLVVLEASGPLTSPKISVSSDHGLSEREILDLLTTGGGIDERTLVNRYSNNYQFTEASLEDDDTPVWKKFFETITRIDSLSLEPTFNVKTGAIEPTIVAKRRLSDTLTLIGESAFASATSESRVRVVQHLTEKMNVTAQAESSAVQSNTALEANLTYTVLAEQRVLVPITVNGNAEVSKLEILAGIRVTEGTPIAVSELPRLEEKIRGFYGDLGFYEAVIRATCESDGIQCKNIIIEAIEGEPSTVSTIDVQGETQKAIKISEEIADLDTDQRATRIFKSKMEQRLIGLLRSEGFIAARVEGSYESNGAAATKILVLHAVTGKQVTFLFAGNTIFTPEDFLQTINLFKRKQPFGSNTIRILVENIQRMYQESGYLYATVAYDRRTEDANGKVEYLITVREEQKVRVKEVKITGNNLVTEAELRRLVIDHSRSDFEDLWDPDFAIEDRLTELTRTLETIYKEAGYPDVTANYRLFPDEASRTVTIGYEVIEGEPVYAEGLVVEGIPPKFELPEKGAAPYSIPKANRYMRDLTDALQSAGYLRPELSADFEGTPQKVHIRVDPGSLTRIRTIQVVGNVSIREAAIKKFLRFSSGDTWSRVKVQETQRRLLSLGLFNRVLVEPTDGTLDDDLEDVTINVVERPLTTLEVGVGANSEYGAHFFGEAVDKALFHDGRALSLRVDTYYDSIEANVSQGVGNFRYSDPYIFGSHYILNEDLRFQKLNLSTQEFDLDRVSLASYASRSWGEGVSATFGHTLAQDNLENVSPDAILTDLDKGIARLSFLSGSVNYDRRDDPISPTEGFNMRFDFKAASRWVGSDAGFYGFGGKISLLYPLTGIDRRFGVALSTAGGSAWTLGGTEEIPITQRYYLGGRNTIRGFKENSLGPLGSERSVLGGDSFVAQNVELRYLTTNQLSLHIFSDAGNIFLRSHDPKYNLLRYSAGVGLRYLSPIGPIGFDVGRPINERFGDSPIRVHFSLGTNF